MPAFELIDVSKRFGRAVEALRGVSLAGEPGEILGLLGPNGAGKTTAIKCLCGLVRPSAGQARLGGVDAREPEARRALGYFPERPRFPEYLTAAELLDREGRLLSIPRPERWGRMALLLDRVGLKQAVYQRRLRGYSKGERARLGLALALMGDPKVVLLDEPSDGLDPLGRKAIRELLRELRDEGRAVLLNSHLLSEVEATSDRLVILNQGRVVAHGTTAELLAARRAVYRVQLAEPPTPQALQALRRQVAELEVEEVYLKLTLERADGIDAVIDLLRAASASIRELRPQANLEDLFVELVAPQPAEAAG